MSEQNKDNISQFFRKAVRKPKISFAESDWENMEARLNAATVAEAPKHNRWKTAFIAAVALLFVSTSLLLYTTRQANTIEENTEVTNATTKPTLATPVPSKNEKPSDERLGRKSAKTKTADENTIHSSHLPNARRTEEVKTSTENNTIKASKETMTSLQSENVHNETLPQHPVASDNVNKVTVMDQPSSKEVTNLSLSGDSCSVEEQKELIVKNEKSLNDSLIENVKPKPSRWNVMLSLSPDFSITDWDKFTTPGDAFGIAAYYTISRGFSISAGMVKSNKIYWDYGNEYKAVQADYWAKKTHGVVPDKIEGSCSVLEIPLGLQYYVATTKKSKLYLASTFSSYIMLKESYQYIFDTPNPGAAESWNAKKTSYSLFSIANLAVGYERSISDRMMIGVSPYVKIPMSGIGAWANVKLYSMGAAFTLRYQFQKKKKPDRLIPAD